MRTVAVSAFGVYGNYPINCSEIIAQRINGTIISGFQIQTVMFQASIPKKNRGRQLLTLSSSLGAAGIISLGMASEMRGLCIEGTAANKVFNEKYVLPRLNNTPIEKRKPYGEKIEINLEPWNLAVFRRACQDKKISLMELSDDAGGFCCNHLMYQVANHQRFRPALAGIPFIFIHIPCSPEVIVNPDAFSKTGKVTMKMDDVVSGLELLLKHSKL